MGDAGATRTVGDAAGDAGANERTSTAAEPHRTERALASTLVGAAATAATTAYSMYAKSQPERHPVAVSIGTSSTASSGGRERSFSIVVPADKTVEWLRARASESLDVRVARLAYRGNGVALNDGDLVFDACRALSPARRDDMLVAIEERNA